MKKTYLILATFIIFLAIFSALLLVDIPSPSKLVTEEYKLEIK